MKIVEIIKKINENEEITKLKKKGFFLCSCFSSTKQFVKPSVWTFHYFNPKTKKIVDCFYKTNIEIGEENHAYKEMKKLETDKINISVEDALKTAEEKFDKSIANILITLHMKKINSVDRVVWTIVVISKDIIATLFDIDAEKGEILDKKETSILRRE